MSLPFINRNIMVPLIKIKDKTNGSIRIVGTDGHDELSVDEDGQIQYYNLQNGEGTGRYGHYSFASVEFVSVEELQEIAKKHAENAKENERKIKELLINIDWEDN